MNEYPITTIIQQKRELLQGCSLEKLLQEVATSAYWLGHQIGWNAAGDKWNPSTREEELL